MDYEVFFQELGKSFSKGQIKRMKKIVDDLERLLECSPFAKISDKKKGIFLNRERGCLIEQTREEYGIHYQTIYKNWQEVHDIMDGLSYQYQIFLEKPKDSHLDTPTTDVLSEIRNDVFVKSIPRIIS